MTYFVKYLSRSHKENQGILRMKKVLESSKPTLSFDREETEAMRGII